MGGIINLLRGSVSLEVEGEFPERFLNLCAQQRVSFRSVERPDEHLLRLEVALTDRHGLEELAQRAGCTLTELDRQGLPPFLARFRTRYALVAGLLLSLTAVCVLSRFVMVFEVRGNELVPDQVILAELWRQGLKPGTYGPALPVRDMANRALLQLDDLSWMTVNLHGIRAEVVVRERAREPEMIDRTECGDLVARAPGLVTGLEVWSGDPAVRLGDTVLPGEVLIRGSLRMDPPMYSEREPEWLPVRAMGKIEGRTWRTLTAVIPLEAPVKTYTGEQKTVIAASVFGQRFNFFGKGGIPFEKYDKISWTWNLLLPDGRGEKITLPVSLEREVYRGYELTMQPVDEAAAGQLLERRLERTLLAQLGPAGQMISREFSAHRRGDRLEVTLTAECREELGRFVPGPPQEGKPYEGENAS